MNSPRRGLIKLYMKYRLLVATMILALGVGLPGRGQATEADSGWVKTDQTSIRLISASKTTGQDGPLTLGLQFQMEPGWKIYWRSPGDAGFPPQLDWNGSKNLASAKIGWPVPHRFSVLGLETLGYKTEVVLPITVQATTPTQGVDLKLALKYLVCSEICVPYDANFQLSLPSGPPEASDFAHLIDTYRAIVPGDGSRHGLKIVSAIASDVNGKKGLRVSVRSEMPFESPDLYLEGAAGLAYGKPQLSFSEDRRQAVLDVAVDGLDFVDDSLGKTLLGRSFTLTLADGKRSAERTLKITANGPAISRLSDQSQSLSFIAVLGLALIGGLILNLMPCVLPVLSIKLISAVGHGGGDRRAVRMSFIASAAGILFSFLILAAALVGLKASGSVIGWGIQFQQPTFLIAMATVIVLFACNLWGFFEVALPQFVSGWSGRAGHARGLGGHFVQGAFATLLATPCSAPFLGTAVGFALARGAAEIFPVFTALGLGLALPYLLVALFPSLATRLPKPGQWMVRLKQILAFALIATAVWLLSVLQTTVGVQGTAIVAVILIALILTLWIAGRYPHKNTTTTPIAVVLVLAAVIYPSIPHTPDPATSPVKQSAIRWQSFDPQAVERMVAAGQTVLVDVTADWCITCQVNKTLVIDRDPVLSMLTGGGVVPMQGDWTLPSDAISRYLARFGRYGIPFNAVFGPNAPEGILLPELLTAQAVVDAVSNASGKVPGAISAR